VVDELGPYLFELVLYNWGEPLLHKQFPEMVAYAKQWDIRVVASSNLSVPVSREYLERLVRSGLDKLKVGMEGTSQEEYERYRVKGDFDLVVKNMQTIQAIKRELGLERPRIRIGFHVFAHNEGSIEKAQQLHQEWGADGISFAASFVSQEAERAGIHPSSIDKFNLYREEGLRGSPDPCTWLWGAIVVNPSGSISPCCGIVDKRSDFEADARAKSILGDVWNNAMYRRARKSETRHHGNGRPIHLVKDGMSLSSIPATDRELICEQCPIPFRKDYVERILDSFGKEILGKVRRAKTLRGRVRWWTAYALMGMPGRGARAKPGAPPEE
jgi:hypothetical protein